MGLARMCLHRISVTSWVEGSSLRRTPTADRRESPRHWVLQAWVSLSWILVLHGHQASSRPREGITLVRLDAEGKGREMLIVGPSIAMSTTSDTGQKTVVPLTIPVATPLALGEDLYRLLLHLSSGIPLL